MNFRSRYRLPFGPALTPMVKSLVTVCGAVYLLQLLGAGREMIVIFGLTPWWVLSKLFLWQPATYLFLHGSFWHLFWNVFGLWMFGGELERYWGKREFLRFFMITGVGAGILSILFEPFSQIPTIGASGAVYGILMAYGVMFPERLVYLYFLFPVKVKYFVAVLGIITFISTLNSSGSAVSHVAHLGGMVFAFLYLKGWLTVSGARQAYYRWKLKRMRERFKVYDSEQRKREDDFWIN
jgi:membrane associated rhomboid family serine protease